MTVVSTCCASRSTVTMNRLATHEKIVWAYFLGLLEWIIPGRLYAKDVSGDIVLVTGAGSGLGRDISLEYAKLGSSLVLWDIDQSGLKETQRLVHIEQAQHLPSPNEPKKFCVIYNVDMSKREAIQEAAKQVHQDLNANNKATDGYRYVSVLVNNAGIYYGKYLHNLTDAQISKMFDINILAHFWTVRAFLPKMIEFKRGHIVEIASFGGICGGFKQVTYCATKFATVGFEESLSVELDHLGLRDHIKSTVICPYYFKSNLLSGLDRHAVGLMTSSYVARETVFAMRCNYSRILLPKIFYLCWLLRSVSCRQSLFAWMRAIGLSDSLKDVKGRALEQE